MSLDLERMRYWTRKGLGGLSDQELIDEDCDELLNLSLWELTDKFPFTLKDSVYSTLLVSGQNQYSISNFALGAILDAIQSVSILDSFGNRHNMARMTRTWFDTNAQANDVDNNRFPERYLRTNTILTLYPTPSIQEDGLTMELSFLESVASLLEGTKETTGLPRNWDELIVEGAITRGHFYFEDYNLSRQALNFQVTKVKQAVPTVSKEEKDTHFGGLGVQWDFPPNSDDGDSGDNPRRAP